MAANHEGTAVALKPPGILRKINCELHARRCQNHRFPVGAAGDSDEASELLAARSGRRGF